MKAKQEHSNLKKQAFKYIRERNFKEFPDLFKGEESKAVRGISSEASCINNPTDCQDFLNYALFYGQKDAVKYLLGKCDTGWTNLFISKELLYNYVVNRGISEKILPSFDEIFAQLDLLNQKIEDLKSKGDVDAVTEANILLARLQKPLILFLDTDLKDGDIDTYKSNSLQAIEVALASKLVKHSGWAWFLHGLARLFTLGKFSSPTESQKVIADIKQTLIDWKRPEVQSEVKDTLVSLTKETYRAKVLKSINVDSGDDFFYLIGDYYDIQKPCLLEPHSAGPVEEESEEDATEKKYLDDDPQYLQDFLNRALALGRVEIVQHLMKLANPLNVTERDDPLMQRPILITKELFYMYAGTQGTLTDEEIHSFDKIFEMLTVIHHKIIEWTPQYLPETLSQEEDNRVVQSVQFLYDLQNMMMQVVHGEMGITHYKQYCRNSLDNLSKNFTDGWEDTLHKLKLSVFGHSKIGSNRFALYTPKNIVSQITSAIEAIQTPSRT